MHWLKYNKTDYKTCFIWSSNSYMFRHHGAIIREFISNKGSWVQHTILGLVRANNAWIKFCDDVPLLLDNLPDDGIVVPKHVGAGTWYEPYFVIWFTVF